MDTKYAVHIFWSDEDQGFIATCDEFPGLSAFGESRGEALNEAQVAIDLMIETNTSSGLSLPVPRKVLLAA